jgi:hypothetical protein
MTVRRSGFATGGETGEGDPGTACMSTCLRGLGLVRVHTMWGRTLPRLAAVMATGLLAGACSSDKLRDQNYGTDLAQGYRYPDGGYPTDTSAGDGGDARDGGDALHAGTDAADAGPDAPDAGAGG